MEGRYELQQKEQTKINRIINEDKFLLNFEMWMSEMKRVKSPVSRKNILLCIRRYLKFCGQEDCTNWPVISDIDNIMRFTREKSVVQNGNGGIKSSSTSYMRGIHYAFKLFFEYAQRKNFIDSNPMDGYNMPILTDEPQREKLTFEDFQKIAAAVQNGNRHGGWRERDILIMQLLMKCGMRETALVSINVDDINLKTGVLTLVDKGNRTHVYNISDFLPQIEKWLSIREKMIEKTD